LALLSLWALVEALVSVSVAAPAALARNMSPPSMALLRTAVLAVGSYLCLLAVWSSSFELFFVASGVAGAGFSAGFLGSIRAVSELAGTN
jgi:hypothetical protein